MESELQARIRAANAEIDPDLLRNSEIRNGEFVRYYGKKSEIVIPDSVATIGEGAFRDNHKLTRVSLGKNVTAIHPNAFRGCRELRSIEYYLRQPSKPRFRWL